MNLLVCNNCSNILTLTTNKPKNIIFNTSEDEDIESKYIAVCKLCNIYYNLINDTILFNQSNNIPISENIKYDNRLMETEKYCDNCKKETRMKYFTSDKNSLIMKLICVECSQIYY